MTNINEIIGNISNDDLASGGSALQTVLQRRQQFLSQDNAALKIETDDFQTSECIINTEMVKQDSELSDVTAKQLETSVSNDNGDKGGDFTPPPSSAAKVIDGEVILVNSTPVIDEEQIAAECEEVNYKVALAANNCQRHQFSMDLTTIPENIHSLVIPESSEDLAIFVQICEDAISAAKKSLKNQKKMTVQEYHHRHEQAREFGFIALDAALKLSVALKEVVGRKGGRSDLHPEKYVDDNRFQYQIFAEDFGLSDKVARRIMQLTPEAVAKEKESANENNEIPTLTHALGYVRAEQKGQQKSKGKVDSIACDNNGLVDVAEFLDKKYDIIYADFNKFNADFDLFEVANDNCLLYLWTDNIKLSDAIDFMRDYNFKYAANAVFVKNKCHPGGKYFKDCHSHVLVGVKGKFSQPEFRREASVAYEYDIGEENCYEYYRSKINLLYPDADLLDLVTKTKQVIEKNEEGVDENISASPEVCND